MQVILGAGYPEYAALRQVRQMGEIHIRLVEDDDFTRLNMGAKLARPDAVMARRRCSTMAPAGQEGLEIEPDMAFGGSLAAAMFGPVQRAAINWMVVESTTWMSRLKRKAKRGVRWPPKAGCKVCRCFQHRPEKLLGQFRITGAVGMRECVLGWRGCASQRRQRSRMQAQRVAHVVETEAVSQLGIEQADDMAPRAEAACVIFDAGGARQFWHQMRPE